MRIPSIVVLLLLGHISTEEVKQIDATEFAIMDTKVESSNVASNKSSEGQVIEMEEASNEDDSNVQ